MDNHTLNLIGLALRAGKLAVGEEPCLAACRSRKCRLLLLASDAGGATRGGGRAGVFLRFAVGRGACLASRGWRVCLRGKVAGCSSEAGVSRLPVLFMRIVLRQSGSQFRPLFRGGFCSSRMCSDRFSTLRYL